MQRTIVALTLALLAGHCFADDDASTATAPAPAVTPRLVAIAPPASADAEATPAGDAGTGQTQFESVAKWAVAGYNNTEIIYTIFVTNHDARILRCTTQLKGAYIESGRKFDVADRQVTTVFPDQQVQVGNWMGLDEKSGATYSVQCRAI